MKIKLVLVITLTFGLVKLASSNMISWETGAGYNNHWYETVYIQSGISWVDASSAAISAGMIWAKLIH